MLGKLLVFFLVPAELLLFLAPYSAINVLLFVKAVKYSLDHTEILIVSHILTVYRIQIAFTECQVMNRIEDIGLTYTILTYETIYFPGEWNVYLFIILEVDKGK
jgi:hypothetical protein